MHTFSTLPAAEGFRMPAEYEPHRGCVMIWPVRLRDGKTEKMC